MRVQCPNCSKVFPVTQDNAGRKAKCDCGTVLQMPQLDQVASPAAGQTIEMSCRSCERRLSVPANAAGKMVKCPCGEQSAVPLSGSAASANAPSEMSTGGGGNDKLANDTYESYRNDPFDSAGSGNSEMASAPAYLTAPKPKPKPKNKKKKKSASAGFDYSQVFGGIAMMVGAVVWFVVGLFLGIIFFYPPILLIIGFVTMIKGFIAP